MINKNASLDAPARVINIGSIDGIRVPEVDNFPYGPSKAAVHHLIRSRLHLLILLRTQRQPSHLNLIHKPQSQTLRGPCRQSPPLRSSLPARSVQDPFRPASLGPSVRLLGPAGGGEGGAVRGAGERVGGRGALLLDDEGWAVVRASGQGAGERLEWVW